MRDCTESSIATRFNWQCSYNGYCLAYQLLRVLDYAFRFDTPKFMAIENCYKLEFTHLGDFAQAKEISEKGTTV
jgi:hypothetical protein